MFCDCLGVFAVLVIALCTCPGATALDIELQSCSHVADTFNSLDLAEGGRESVLSRHSIYKELQQGPGTAQNGVCDLERSCCVHSAELLLKNATTQDYQQQVQNMLTEILMPCHNHNFSGEMVNYIQQSKATLRDTFQTLFSIYFTPYLHIFDEFYDYLEQSILTGDLCDIEEMFTEVSFEVYLSSLIVAAQANGLDYLVDTEMGRPCLFDYFLETSSDTVTNRLTGFLRSYNVLMRYIRALRLMDMVIEGCLDLPLTRQCQDALLKMTYCSQCAGYSADLLPCQGLCQNSLRGCLVDLSDLVEPIQEFTDSMVNMKRVLVDVYNPWDQITLLNSHFFIISGQAANDDIQVVQPLTDNVGVGC